MDGWNTIVSFWGLAYFQGRTVSFREGNASKIWSPLPEICFEVCTKVTAHFFLVVQLPTFVQPLKNYCWWLKSCTSWYGKYTIIYMVSYIPGGAGFLPSTVCQWYFWKGEVHWTSFTLFRIISPHSSHQFSPNDKCRYPVPQRQRQKIHIFLKTITVIIHIPCCPFSVENMKFANLNLPLLV